MGRYKSATARGHTRFDAQMATEKTAAGSTKKKTAEIEANEVGVFGALMLI